MDRARRTIVQYGLELGGAAVLFVLAMGVREPLAARLGPGLPAALALALPLVPLWLMFVAIWRHYVRVDEYQRLQFLKATALASGLALFAFASLPFLGGLGVPRAASEVLWIVIPLGWFVALFIVHVQKRSL
jgi:hypothetical protein